MCFVQRQKAKKQILHVRSCVHGITHTRCSSIADFRAVKVPVIVSLYLILGTYRQLFTASCCPPTHIHAKYQVYHLRRTARLTWYPFCGTRICYTRSTSHPKYIAAFLLGLLHLADGRRKIYKTCTRRTFEYRYGMSEIFQPRAAHGCRPSLFIVLSVASSTSN